MPLWDRHCWQTRAYLGEMEKQSALKYTHTLPGRRCIDTNSETYTSVEGAKDKLEILNILSVVQNKKKDIWKNMDLKQSISVCLIEFTRYLQYSTHMGNWPYACTLMKVIVSATLKAEALSGGRCLPVLRAVSNKVLDDPVHGSAVPGEHGSGQRWTWGMHAC